MEQQQIINQLLTILPLDSLSEDEFNQIALQIFAYQYTNNLPLSEVLSAKRENHPDRQIMEGYSGCAD